MQQRKLGSNGPVVSALGLGCMGMSDFYSTGADRQEAIATLHRALELGVTLLDTADMYGPHTNEELVGRRSRASGNRCSWPPSSAFCAIRRIRRRAASAAGPSISGARWKAACGAWAWRIDLYYQHRVDPQVPIEDVVGTMADLILEGKIRHIGLSEASVATLERAHKVHPITALQTEYSLWTRDAEQGVLAACERLGIGFVPYSPLGRGFLTGAIRRPEDLAEDDFRRGNPRFQGENFARNLALVEKVSELAAQKGVKPSQLALAWVLAQGEHIVPIPGTKRRRYLEENVAAAEIALSAAELAAIEAVFPLSAAAGDRYGAESMTYING